MNKAYGAVAAIIVLGFIGAFVAAQHGASNANTGAVPAQANVEAATTTSTSNSGAQAFGASQYVQYAYLISTSTYDANTQKALTGFTVSKTTNPDGSLGITLNAQNPEYKTQQYTVQQGQKLYFIERSLGDDQNGQDRMLRDDTAILIDSQGNIVN